VDWLCRPMCSWTCRLQQLSPFIMFRRLPGNAVRCFHYSHHWPVPEVLQTTRRALLLASSLKLKIQNIKIHWCLLLSASGGRDAQVPTTRPTTSTFNRFTRQHDTTGDIDVCIINHLFLNKGKHGSAGSKHSGATTACPVHGRVPNQRRRRSP
jgi:hypothetical protein